MKSLSCLIDLTSYQTFKTTLNTKHETLTDKYMLTKFKTELHSRLNMSIILRSRHLRQ